MAKPACRCGREMAYSKTETRSSDALVKFFVCSSCSHEMRVMVWRDLDGLSPNEAQRAL